MVEDRDLVFPDHDAVELGLLHTRVPLVLLDVLDLVALFRVDLEHSLHHVLCWLCHVSRH